MKRLNMPLMRTALLLLTVSFFQQHTFADDKSTCDQILRSEVPGYKSGHLKKRIPESFNFQTLSKKEMDEISHYKAVNFSLKRLGDKTRRMAKIWSKETKSKLEDPLFTSFYDSEDKLTAFLSNKEHILGGSREKFSVLYEFNSDCRVSKISWIRNTNETRAKEYFNLTKNECDNLGPEYVPFLDACVDGGGFISGYGCKCLNGFFLKSAWFDSCKGYTRTQSGIEMVKKECEKYDNLAPQDEHKVESSVKKKARSKIQ